MLKYCSKFFHDELEVVLIEKAYNLNNVEKD
jgi:hypothetical protein